jgi:hypothetical protein
MTILPICVVIRHDFTGDERVSPCGYAVL